MVLMYSVFRNLIYVNKSRPLAIVLAWFSFEVPFILRADF